MKLILSRKHKIIIIITALIITFLFSILVDYTNDVLLPVKLKPAVIQELEKKLNKDVQIGRMHYNPFKGLTVQDLVIATKTKDLYLQAREVSFKFLILPLFQTNVIIPSIYFKDGRYVANYTKEINDLKINLGWNLHKQINFTLQAKIFDSLPNPSLVSAAGTYIFSKQALYAKVNLNNISISDYLLYLGKLPLSIADGVIAADLKIDLRDKKIALNGMAYIKHLELRKNRFSLSGNIDIQSDIKYDFQNKRFEYRKGRLGLSGATLSGLKYIEDISNIRGNIYLEENKIWLYGLKANIRDEPVDIKGKAELFSNQLSWENVTIVYKQIPYQCSGNMDITDFEQPKIELQLSSKDLALKTNLNVKDKIINIRSCTGRYLNNEFTIKGLVDIKERLLKLDAELGFSLKDFTGFFSKYIDKRFKKIKTDKDISGILNTKLNMHTNMRLPLPTLEAKGSFIVKDANLWELNLFKRLGEFLSLPMYQKISFEDGGGNFVMHSRDMYVSDLYLKSKELNFNWKGKISINGSLDLMVDVEINKDLIKELTGLKSVLPNIGNLLTIEVKGSLRNPTYKFAYINEETIDQTKQTIPPQ